MRRNLTKLVLTGLLLLGGMATLKAQTQPVVPYGQIWSYLLTNATPVGWNASNYPASTNWFIGAGVLAFPGDEPMPNPFAPVQTLLDTNFNGNIVTSFYFRTEFLLTNVITSNLVINASAIVDDGAVIYINGREISPRIRMPNGTITHNTFANAGGEVAARVDTFRIAATNFVRGTNVVAVEVHQDAAASSDVVFGLQLAAGFIDTTTIATQPYPQSQTIDTGQRALFTVGALGSDVRYQWFTNNVPVSGANTRYFQTPIINAANTGIVVHVIASNEVNSVRSSDSILTVVTDRNGPAITNLALEATGNVTNRVRLDLNEGTLSTAIYPAILNTNNYSITVMEGTNVSTNRLTITNVTLTTGVIRLFTAERMNRLTNYAVCAYNLPDARSNFTAAVCAAFETVSNSTIFPMGSQWQLQNTTRDLSLDNWEAPTYPDTANNGWGTGAGGFVNDPDVWSGCVDRVTATSRGTRTTYFRHDFTVTAAGLGPTTNNPVIQIVHATDDGAVFYLNGQEIYRYNMPAAPTVVNFFTVATGAVGNATACQSNSIPVPRGLFRIGNNANVLAVEVHQQEADLIAGDTDVAFDMGLNFQYRFEPAIPISISQLTIARGAAPGTVLITWTGAPDFRLQEAPAITGPWSLVTGAPNVGNNGYQTTATQQRFYRTAK